MLSSAAQGKANLTENEDKNQTSTEQTKMTVPVFFMKERVREKVSFEISIKDGTE